MEKSPGKKLVKSNKPKFEIAFLTFLNFFLIQKINFWPFLKQQKIEFGQKKFFVKLIYLISRVFLAQNFLNFLAHCVSGFWECRGDMGLWQVEQDFSSFFASFLAYLMTIQSGVRCKSLKKALLFSTCLVSTHFSADFGVLKPSLNALMMECDLTGKL